MCSVYPNKESFVYLVYSGIRKKSVNKDLSLLLKISSPKGALCNLEKEIQTQKGHIYKKNNKNSEMNVFQMFIFLYFHK